MSMPSGETHNSPNAPLLPDLAPPESIALARFRGNLLLEQATADETVKKEEIVDYEKCTATYDRLWSTHQATEERFLDALGAPRRTWQGGGLAGATRYQHVLLEQQPEADIVHQVEVERDPQRKFFTYRGGALRISTYLLEKLTHSPDTVAKIAGVKVFSGNHEGYAIVTGNRLHEVNPWPQDQLQMTEFRTIKNELLEGLKNEGRRQALAPFAGQLAAMQDGYEETGGTARDSVIKSRAAALFGSSIVSSTNLPLARVLAERFIAREQALDALTDALSPDSASAFNTLLTQPMYTQMDELSSHKLTDRFTWLTDNLATMRQVACEGARHHAIFNFAAGFGERMQLEEVKINRLKALAQKYEAMTNISAFAPNDL